MDFVGIIIFLVIVIFASYFKGKNKKFNGLNEFLGAHDARADGEKAPEFIVPPVLNKLMPGGKEMEKIMTVYGPGALVTVDDAAVLLNVSQEAAQDYLSRLIGEGRAEHSLSASGKVRYKLK